MDQLINFSLCSDGNQYDTKIYIYEDYAYNLYACNDDYCVNSWSTYVSYIGPLALFGGHTYYIIVDGYGGDSGLYELVIDQSPDCPDICPSGAVLEGEPPLTEGYVDTYNGGCNSYPPVFQDIDWVNAGEGCSLLCGTSGWYIYEGESRKDYDFFNVVSSGDQIDITIIAEEETFLYVVDPVDCNNYTIVSQEILFPCNQTSLSIPTPPGAEYWIVLTPTGQPLPLGEYSYYSRISGIQSDTVSVDCISWSRLKALYR
jgi:hypothetical protein